MKWTKADAEPPAIDELSLIFRTTGVDLTVSACTKALQEACLVASDVTHVVAVTCSDQSTPGYDLFVCQKLGLQPGVQRVMLQGVGCAGGLAALRAAADIAAAASQRGRPARILVFACELCTLFSDAAAALVVCNGFAVGEKQKPIFEIMEGASMLVPETSAQMSSNVMKNGMIATITKDVPKIAVSAISPMFEQLRHTLGISNNPSPLARLQPAGFDWAIHPGGAAILRGAKQAMHLTDDHIRASLEIYRTRGNSSSPTVLVVLDSLRRMGRGRDNVVATSFGPGLTIEMCIMKRCRHDDQAQPTCDLQHSTSPGVPEEAPQQVPIDADLSEPDETPSTPAFASFRGRLTKYRYTETVTRAQDGLAAAAALTPSTKRTRTTVTAVVQSGSGPSLRPKKKRKTSKYADPSKYAHLSPLLDILEPNLICVFVGTNPGVQTAAAGHAYAHPSNLFWKLLYSSGLTDRRLKPEEDRSLPALYCMGNTNIVERPSKDAAELSKDETAAGTENLNAKFLKYKPEATDFKYGWQDEKHNMGKSKDGEDELDSDGDVWRGSKVFVTTSTSGLAANLKPAEKEAIWKPFGEWVRKRRAKKGFVPRQAEAAQEAVEKADDS
ncbi:polyketide synthase PksE [Clathrospora elynae]|uniref:Polyketide synthase PksE n=1 Tax=Clathrospora elynae TaxID=706981 RepID=A0A6A5SHD2_9PLEO|nr:polyketide synthase PksE [Clathrospora elynae]